MTKFLVRMLDALFIDIKTEFLLEVLVTIQLSDWHTIS
jgi:hypothetical protein